MANDVIFNIIANPAAFTKGMATVSASAAKTSQSLNNISKQASANFLKGAAAIGAFTFAFAKLETQLKNINSLLSKDEIGKFGETIGTDVKAAISDFGFGIESAGKAMFDTVSALGAGERATKTFKAAQVLAIGGVTDISIAVDGLTSVMNAYKDTGLSSTKAANIFFAAQKRGKTTVAELANNIGKVATIANKAGVSFEETAAATATLTLAGLRTDLAVTGLKNLLQGLLKPSSDAAKNLKALGIPMGITELKSKGLGFALRKVNEAYQENNDSITKIFPNIRALLGATGLTGEALDKYDMILKETQTDTESLNKAFQDQTTSMVFAGRQMRGTITLIAAAIGEQLAPVVFKLNDVFKNLFKEIKKHPEIVKMAAKILFLATAFFGLLAIVTKVAAIIVGFVSLITGPIGLVIIALGLLFLAFKKNFLGIATILKVAFKVVKFLFKAWAALFLIFNPLLGALFLAFKFNLFGIRDLVTKVFDSIKKRFSKIFNTVKKFVKGIRGLFKKGKPVGMTGLAPEKAGKSTTAITPQIDQKNVIEQFIATFNEIQKNSLKAGKESGKAFTSAFIGAIKNNEDVFVALGKVMQDKIIEGIVTDLFTPIAGAMQLLTESIINTFTPLFTELLSPLTSFFKATLDGFTLLFKNLQKITTKFATFFKTTWTVLKTFFQGIWSALGVIVEGAVFTFLNPIKAMQIAFLAVQKAAAIAWALIWAIPTGGGSLSEIPVAIAQFAAGVASINAVGLAGGGILPNLPRGDTMLAGFNPNEQVLKAQDASKIQEGRAILGTPGALGGGGLTLNIEVTGNTFGSETTDDQVRDIFESASEQFVNTNLETVFKGR